MSKFDLMEFLRATATEIQAQDSRATADPVWEVQRRVRTYGMDVGYTDRFVWVDDHGSEECDPDVLKQLNEDYDAIGKAMTATHRRVGILDHWESVDQFFTEKAAKQYIANNAFPDFNDGEPSTRLFVNSLHRNQEMMAVRSLLAGQALEMLEQRDDVIKELSAALSGCMEQIAQMKGMFNDEDHAIENSLNDADTALELRARLDSPNKKRHTPSV